MCVLLNYKNLRNSVERSSCADKLFSVVSFILVKFLSTKRGITPRKYCIRISCGYAHQHIKYFKTTKFQEILLSGLRGVALTNFFE